MKNPIVCCLLFLFVAGPLGGCGSDGGSDPCQTVDCGQHGSCNPDTGTCQCDDGYTGLYCQPCAAGYHMEDGVCVQDESLEIIGSYTDDWDFTHEITASSWDMSGSIFHISQFDNEKDFLVARNDSANEYNPDRWSRFDWVFDGDQLYYCQIVFDAADEQAALAADGADRSDLAGGCNGFGWSALH